MLPARDPAVQKVIYYLLGVLLNLCSLQEVNCSELIGLNGIPLLLGMIQLTNEKVTIYALKIIRVCCKTCPVARDHMATHEGVIRVMNAFSSPNSQVVLAAIELIMVVLNGHDQNTELFRVAQGLYSLMQIESWWEGSCGVKAAKTISNLLHEGNG